MAAQITDLAGLPFWPRLLSQEQAAAYCGMSGEHFAKHAGVQPRRFGRRVLYDRCDIDRWLDAAEGRFPTTVDIGALFG